MDEDCGEKLAELMRLVSKLQPSRQVALAKTKLEEAGHWLEADRRAKME